MVSKDSGTCTLTPPPESEVEPAACLALEMKYTLDPNRQIKKRNKALQVRFKDICEAQNEQRDAQPLAAGQPPPSEKREARPSACRSAHRKYMTVPARRSIPNVTKSTGVQTSPDLRKCYQTFPLDRKKGNLKGLPAQNNGFLADTHEAGPTGEARPFGAGNIHKTTALVFRSSDHMDEVDRPPAVNCAEPCRSPDLLSSPQAPLQNSSGSPGQEPALPAHGTLFKTEVATVYTPALGATAAEPDWSDSAAASQWSLCPADEEPRRAPHLNGLQAPPDSAATCSPPTQCLSPRCGEPGPEKQSSVSAAVAGEECQQIVPHTEVVDLKAQLHMMENLISSSQETIKVLLGVIQELEKGEAHREGLSYRTGQDTANCDTCRNSACIIYSVELDFKQQEDKLQPVLRKLQSIEETQVAPSPYSQETSSSTPKQKSKPESKKHGRWKLWFL
ncbi:inhibitory synaptic factor 2A [Ochotona princeps]|uniref:inhibitory synaptic factor 2A n=1 Tax=Ochotona princeps TaxID=9978 RepID=UPI00271509D7|nr:inhibitory synaptic factor 2A [Ochotona princeps]